MNFRNYSNRNYSNHTLVITITGIMITVIQLMLAECCTPRA